MKENEVSYRILYIDGERIIRRISNRKQFNLRTIRKYNCKN